MACCEVVKLSFYGVDNFRAAIINPSQVHQSYWDGLPVEAVVPSPIKSIDAMLPRVLPIGKMRKEDCAEVVEIHNRLLAKGIIFLSALLKSEQPVERLINHIKRQLILRGPDGDSVVFSFYNPNVFRHLLWLLDIEQMDLLLGPITEWHGQDSRHRWHSYTRSGHQRNGTLALSRAQWRDLQDIGLLNECLAGMEKENSSLHDNSSNYRQILDFLALAKEKGLISGGDRCLYAHQGMRWGTGFHRDPEIAWRLDKAINGRGTYVALCEDLDGSKITASASC